MDKWTLKKIRINSQGYDSKGRYFGTGQTLWEYAGEDENYCYPVHQYVLNHVRADNRADAKQKIIARYPSAKFYR